MEIVTQKLIVQTQAEGEMQDLTEEVRKKLEEVALQEGVVHLFCVGSTFSLSTVEYEPGLLQDVPAALDRIAPQTIAYAHHETWHDDNGRSHVKATLMGPSLTIPFTQGELTLGRWQQIALFEWDTRPRTRQVVVQFMGTS